MDWLERRQATLDRLAGQHGSEWIDAHRADLEEQWRYVADLEGFDPDTGESQGSKPTVERSC